jgi:glycosyltransferase involved in cell wall biosynthesis
LRAELGIAPDIPIIGSIGRLEPVKGYDMMIDAFSGLLTRGEDADAVLVIAGEGSQRGALEARIREHRLRGRVFVLGWRDDVLDLHSAFTVFTMSSRSEGTSVSLLEAMSAGIPPVVTNVGGNSAVLGDALRFRAVPAHDSRALAAAWAELLARPDLRARERALARARVIDAYGLDGMVRAYERLYSGVA